MQKAIVRRTFDVVKNQRQEPIYAAKGDYGARYIQAIITVDGVPYAIPENAIVTINAFRRDGKTNRFKGEVNADGSVIVPITQWMLEILGMVDCTISAVEEGGMLTTENFYVVANESSTNVEVSPDDQQYDLLTEVLLNEGTRQKQFSDMVEFINSLEQGKQGPAGPAGIHIGPEAPTDGQVAWIDTNEEPSAEEGGVNFDVVAKPGQVIAVKAVDVEGKPKEYKAVDLPVHDAPDWNAAEGEAGHVLNRTHYVDEKGVVHKLNNKYIDADWMATSKEGGGNDVVISEQKLTSGMWDNLQMAIQPGFEYDVHINDVIYPCVALSDDDGIFLGNNYSLTLNDYPFCILWAGGYATGGFFYRDSNVLSFPLYMKVTDHAYTKYNELPEGFLPKSVVKSVNGAKPDEKGNVQIETGGGSGIDVTAEVGQTIIVKEVDASGKPTKWESADYQPRTHWSETERKVLFDGTVTTQSNMGSLPSVLPLEVGKTYSVTFGGTTYSCVAKDGMYNSSYIIYLGNDYAITGVMGSEPFAVFSMLTYGMCGVMVIMADGDYPIKIEADVTTYHKIPSGFIQPFRQYYVFDLDDKTTIQITKVELSKLIENNVDVVLRGRHTGNASLADYYFQSRFQDGTVYFQTLNYNGTDKASIITLTPNASGGYDIT